MLYIGMLVYRAVFDKYATYNDRTGKYAGQWNADHGTLWKVVRTCGQYAKLERVHPYLETSVWQRMERITRVPDSEMFRAMRSVERAYTYKAEQIKADAEHKATADAKALSQNTVTRALVHAADNGYCNETVIALVSAGHKMPEGTVTLRVTVDIPVEIDGKEDYYIMRSLFGATRGNLDKIIGSGIPSTDSGYETLESKLGEKLGSIGAEVNWQTWQNARIEGIDIQFPAPVIRPIEDVQSAPAAHYDGRDGDY